MSLVVQDLSKKYGTRTVVDHLSFEMNRPGVYALLGRREYHLNQISIMHFLEQMEPEKRLPSA